MSSLFPLSAQCQLTKYELEQLLLLPDRVVFATDGVSMPHPSSPSSSSPSSLNAPTASTSSMTPVKATLGGVVCHWLSAAHTRRAVTDALVRVVIPKSKRPSLLAANPYVQLEQSREESERAATQGRETRTTSAAPAARESMNCRVGRVVALLQKPSTGVKAAATTTTTSASASTATASNTAASAWSETAQAELDQWLVVVQLGDCVEPFPLKTISNEPFTEAEHRVYVRTTAKAQENATAVSSATGNVSSGLLSAAQAEMVQQTVTELRELLEVVYRTTSTRAQDVMARLGLAAWRVAQATAEGHLAFGVKRERDADGAGTASVEGSQAALKRVKRETGAEDDITASGQRRDEAAAAATGGDLRAALGGGDASESARVAHLTAENAQAHLQLQSLRQLLASKDTEVKRQMQKQRQTLQASEAEAEQLHAKLEEEARTHRREREEAELALREEKKAKEAAQAMVTRLVDVLQRLKSVTTQAATVLGMPETSKPEEVLAALKAKGLP